MSSPFFGPSLFVQTAHDSAVFDIRPYTLSNGIVGPAELAAAEAVQDPTEGLIRDAALSGHGATTQAGELADRVPGGLGGLAVVVQTFSDGDGAGDSRGQEGAAEIEAQGGYGEGVLVGV
ncbi:hypothetical protein PC116_g28586, partial [Phytophthora cactorum]